MTNLKLIITMLCCGPFILRGATLDGVVIRCSQSDTRLRPSVATGSALKNAYAVVVRVRNKTADVTLFEDQQKLGPTITLLHPRRLKLQDVVDYLNPKYAGVSKRFILSPGTGETQLRTVMDRGPGEYCLLLTLEDIDTLRHCNTDSNRSCPLGLVKPSGLRHNLIDSGEIALDSANRQRQTTARHSSSGQFKERLVASTSALPALPKPPSNALVKSIQDLNLDGVTTHGSGLDKTYT